MRNNLQTRSRLLTVIMAGVASALLATGASAASGGGKNEKPAKAESKASVMKHEQNHAGGSAEAHQSTSGAENSNAQWQNDATRSADRAETRHDMKDESSEPTKEKAQKSKRKSLGKSVDESSVKDKRKKK